MSEQEKPWATHYCFLDFPICKPYYLPKEGLSTWHDLKYNLDDLVRIDYRYIDIVVNGRRVFYHEETMLEDIDLKPTDQCIVTVRRDYDREKQVKEKSDYEREVEQDISRNSREIQKRLNEPDNKKVLASINISNDKRTLLTKLVKEFSKWECLVAFQNCRPEQEQLRKYLAAGKAKLVLQEQVEAKERAEIEDFLRKEDVKELKRTILDKNKSPVLYGKLMHKLFEKYPAFRQLEIKHQTFVQTKLLGKELFSNGPTRLQKQVQSILESVKVKSQPARLTEAALNAFQNPFIIEGSSHAQISKTISLAGNNLALAAEYIKSGPAYTSNNVVMCLKKSSRMNLVLQFFNQPAFVSILPKLASNRRKSEAFIDSITQRNKDSHPLLCTLIKKYRLHILTILTGAYCLQKEKQLENKQLIFVEQLTPNKRNAQKERILKEINQPLIEQLVKNGVSDKLAISAVRASENDQQRLQRYLWLGGINRKYDFCIENKQNEQIYIQKYFRKESKLLERLRKDEQAYASWLAAICETSPLLFQMVIRNKILMDKLVNGEPVLKA